MFGLRKQRPSFLQRVTMALPYTSPKFLQAEHPTIRGGCLEVHHRHIVAVAVTYVVFVV